MSEGISQSGSVAEQAGVKFEEYVSMLASTMEITRLAGSQVGNAFKTIFSRMGRVKDSAILEETETSTESINKMEEALDGLGIKLRDSRTGDFKPTGEVLGELATVWQTLSKAEQSYIAETGAGVRQKNIFLALMESMSGETERYTSLLKEAQNAEGAGEKAQETYMSSLEAKINQLKTTTTEMWQTLIDSGVVSAFVDGLETIVSGISSISKAINTLADGAVPVVVATTIAFTTLGATWTSIGTKIAVLKGGFAELKGSLIATTLGLKNSATATKVLSADAIKTVGVLRTLAGALAGIGVGLAISAVVGLFQKMANKAKEAREEFAKMTEELNAQTQKVSSLAELIDKQEEYTKVLSEGVGTTEELYNATSSLEEVEKEIANMLPSATTAWDKYGEAKAGNIETNKNLLEVEKELQKTMLENTVLSGQATAEKNSKAMEAKLKKMEEYKTKLLKAQEELDRVEEEKKNVQFEYENKQLYSRARIETENIDNYSSKMQTLQSEINDCAGVVDDYNRAVKKLNEEHETSYKTVDDLSTIYSILEQSKNGARISSEEYLAQLEEEKKTEEELLEIKKEIQATSDKAFSGSYDDMKKELNEAIDLSEEYKSILKDITDEQGNFNPKGELTISTVQKIVSDHQELVGYLGDERAMYDFIIAKLQECGEQAENSYRAMMFNSEEYFSQNIAGTSQWEGFLLKVLKNLEGANYKYYNLNADAMKTELQNAKSLAQARLTIESQMLEKLARKKKEAMEAEARANELANQIAISGAEGEHFRRLWAKAQEQKKQYDAMLAEYNALINDLNNLGNSITVPGNIISGISKPGSSSSTGGSKDSDDLELEIDRYYKLNKAIQDVNHQLQLNDSAKQTATGEEYVKLLEEENRLLEQQKKLYQDLRAEQLKELNEKKSQLGKHGFNIDSNNQITNYAERLKQLQDWANSATGDEKRKRQEEVKRIEALVNAYIQLNESIQQTDQTIGDFNNQLADNKQEMEDYYNSLLDKVTEVEDKITSALEKEIEKRRKAIEDEYDERVKMIQKTKELYNKQNQEEDYKKNLSTEQQKLSELQQAINEAMRDTSQAGRARLAELQKQFAEQQGKIESMILQHERDKANDRFDEEIKQAEDEKDKALASFDAKYDEKAIAQMVTELIANGWTQIGDEIISVEEIYRDFEDMFGDGMTILGDKIKEEFIANLKEAQEIMKNMGDIFDKLGINADFAFSNGNSGSGRMATFAHSSSDSNATPMSRAVTTNPSLGGTSVGAVSGAIKQLGGGNYIGENNSTVEINFENLVNVQGNVMKDLVPQLKDVVNQAVKELDTMLTSTIKTRMGRI